MVAYMVAALADVPGLEVRRVSPSEPGVQPNWIPRMHLDWDKNHISLNREAVKSHLMQTDPGIAVGTTPTGLFVNPQTLMPGQEKIVAQRLREVLSKSAG
jgi:hypothetical protein